MIMKKMMKYALVALMAVAMLFSFASCSDDDDDDDDKVAVSELTDSQIVDLVADGLVAAITTNYSASSETAATSDYSSWTLDTTGVTITTTSAYSGSFDEENCGSYTVAIGTGSTVTVTYVFDDNYSVTGYKVEVSVDATIDGVDEDLALTYDMSGETSNSLTINNNAADITDTELSSLITTLITGVTTAMSSSSSQA